jgi:adenylate cyclase
MPQKPTRSSQNFGAVFLEETEATVVVFDLRGFSRLSAALAPLDLGLALGHYYEHAEGCVLAHKGRLVKFAGDAVFAAWLANETSDHKQKAVAAVAEANLTRPAWLERNQGAGMPVLDYSVAAATGPVLAGHIGTPRHKSFDVLGAPVNTAAKLTTVATARGVDHLLALQVPEHASVEVEGIEIGGQMIRLFRLGAGA